jgi:pyoverdine/dityrosine biosynthesis protein Dit1
MAYSIYRQESGTMELDKTMSYREVEAKTEIISRTSIDANFLWPETDPRILKQDIREYRFSDDEIIRSTATVDFGSYGLVAKKSAVLEEQIIALLNHPFIQFNSRKRFGNHRRWRDRIASACKDGRPIEILLLAFCVINNPVKRLQGTTVTAAEMAALCYMQNISRQISAIYSPGLVFNIVSDSTFYSPVLKINAVHAKNYITSLSHRVADLELESQIKIFDITDILVGFSAEFEERFSYWLMHFLKNPFSDGLSSEHYYQWLQSMILCLNTKDLSYSYEQLKHIYGKSLGHDYVELKALAEKTLAEYRALKAASSDVNWEDAYFPNSIRATIHAKKAPVLGLRIYPRYKRGSRLLPYHGIAVISQTPQSDQYEMDIAQEIMVCGNDRFRKVVDQRGVTMFYERKAQ